jgi:hypothetical protein
LVIHKDFTVSAENLTWVGRADLVELVPGRRFQTPDHFYSATFTMFLNGVLVEKNNDDGYVIIDDQTFETKETYLLPRMRVSVGYVKKTA